MPYVKRCDTCKELKPLVEYRKTPRGEYVHSSTCNECEQPYIEPKKKRTPAPGYSSEVRRAQYLKYRDKIRERMRKKYLENKGKPTTQKRLRKRRSNTKSLAARCRHRYGYSVAKGETIPLKWCQLCGRDTLPQGPIQAHHADYNYPLSVVYLCTFHHNELHR